MSTRPRVLVEVRDPSIGWATERLLERVGYDVRVCWGPCAEAGRQCPLSVGERCPLVEGADGIAFLRSVHVTERTQLLADLRAGFPQTPMLVEIPRPDEEQHPDLLEGCEVIHCPATPRRLLDAVDDMFSEMVWDTASRAFSDPLPRSPGGG